MFTGTYNLRRIRTENLKKLLRIRIQTELCLNPGKNDTDSGLGKFYGYESRQKRIQYQTFDFLFFH